MVMGETWTATQGYDRYDIMCGLNVNTRVSEQSPDIALGVDKDGAGDQGIMYGYATNETPEMMPLPFMVATKFLNILRHHPSRMFRADAKAEVSFDYDSNRITTFLCSVQHSPDVEVSDFRHIIEGVMVLAAAEYGLNTDFEKLINPTGRFIIGGSFADCGVTGRKLACDTYYLTPKGIIRTLGLLDVDYNKISAYGHFGKACLPWE